MVHQRLTHLLSSFTCIHLSNLFPWDNVATWPRHNCHDVDHFQLSQRHFLIHAISTSECRNTATEKEIFWEFWECNLVIYQCIMSYLNFWMAGLCFWTITDLYFFLFTWCSRFKALHWLSLLFLDSLSCSWLQLLFCSTYLGYVFPLTASLNVLCCNSIWRNMFAGPSIDLLSPDDHRASSPPPSHLWSNITSSLIPFQPSKYYWKAFLPLRFYLHYAFVCNLYMTDIHSACFLHYTVRMQAAFCRMSFHLQLTLIV